MGLACPLAVLLLQLWRYPLGPPTHQLLQSISLLGRWSTSGSDRGIANFFTATRKYNRGSGRKRTNEQNEQYEPGVNSKYKTRSYVTLCIPVSIYRLTLAWISSENSTTHEECWLILTRLPSLLLTSSHPTGLSAVRCRPPCPSSVANCLLRVPLSNSFLAFPYLLPVTPRSRVQNPLSGFVPKQTKGSSAWRTTYIVLHNVEVFCVSIRRTNFHFGISIENHYYCEGLF